MSTHLTLQLQKSSIQQKFEFNLEGLRGFAAMLVVFHHILSHKFSLDSEYSPNAAWLNQLPGHSSVLIFFILSGYVIGLTNTKSLTNSTIVNYIRKRLVRLYPIYIISLVFTLIITNNIYSLKTIIGNFLFLQNSIVSVIFENNPLWSLNSEIIFYILFIPLSYFRINYGWTSIICIILGIFFITLSPHALLSSYIFGFAFWTSGLWLARTQKFTKINSSVWLLTALLLFFVGYESINPFTPLLSFIEIKYNLRFARLQIPGVFIEDVINLPFYFFIFLRFANRTTKHDGLFVFFMIFACLSNYCYTISVYGITSNESQELTIPMVCFIIGSITFIMSLIASSTAHSTSLPTFLLRIGSLSYGIYVIHFPISIVLSHIKLFSGSLLTFICRLLVDIVLVIIAAFLLEIKIQPWFKKRLASTA